MKVINLTQHQPTQAQQNEVNFVELTDSDVSIIHNLITFKESDFNSSLPSEMVKRANLLAELALNVGADYAMIGGAPYFQGVLETALQEKGIGYLYALSERRVVEHMDGNVVSKMMIFEHIAFIGKDGMGIQVFI